MEPNIIAGHANIIKKGKIDEKIVCIVCFMLNDIPQKMNDWQYNDNNCTNMIAI